MEKLELEKFDSLKELYSERYIKLLKEISIQTGNSFDDIYSKLPSSDLVKKDETFIDTYPVARVLLGVADPASHVLTAFYLISEIPKDYPEQPKYYISKSEGSVKAPFTKQEFLDSIRKEDSKKKKLKIKERSD